MPIRYTTDDTRSNEQAAADDQTREEVERSGGVWAQMSPEQRAQEARARRQAEHDALEERVARLEERVSRLED